MQIWHTFDQRPASTSQDLSIIASAPSVKGGYPHPVSAFSPATPSPRPVLARVVEEGGAIRIVATPVTEDQARIAREAYRDFGKGSGHPARLNFGDCFAYALAKVTGEPLLFKGDDFGFTDIAAAQR